MTGFEAEKSIQQNIRSSEEETLAYQYLPIGYIKLYGGEESLTKAATATERQSSRRNELNATSNAERGTYQIHPEIVKERIDNDGDKVLTRFTLLSSAKELERKFNTTEVDPHNDEFSIMNLNTTENNSILTQNVGSMDEWNDMRHHAYHEQLSGGTGYIHPD